MSAPFMGQITTVGFNWAPLNYAMCDGQVVAIGSKAALYSLIGNYYGGDGRSTFAYPNLQSRTPVGQGLLYYSQDYQFSYPLGQFGGREDVTLTASQMAPHTHEVACYAGNGDSRSPRDNYFAIPNRTDAPTTMNVYSTSPSNLISLDPGVMSSTAGGGAAHYNLQPSLVINFIIALDGAYPQRN